MQSDRNFTISRVSFFAFLFLFFGFQLDFLNTILRYTIPYDTIPVCRTMSAGSGFQVISPRTVRDPLSVAHHSGHSGAAASSSSVASASTGPILSSDEPMHDGDEHGDDETSTLTVPGDVLASAALFMRGHGTYLGAGGSIASSLSGVLQRTNKLLSVRAVRSVYTPEVGDLVVGRIVEVGAKRWRVDVNATVPSALPLASINLPGGVQRRKLESDELQMRSFFAEHDLLVAEVQTVFADGSTGLHTRSLRYGKLRNGVLVTVPRTLVRRIKSHFVHLTNEHVDMVLGLNGYIWVAMHVPFDPAKAEGEAGSGTGRDIDGVYAHTNAEIPHDTRNRIARVAKIIHLLADHGLTISDESVQAACEAANHIVGPAPAPLSPTDQDTIIASLRVQ